MSSRNGNRNKGKKHVPTTLGRAPSGLNSEELDLAHLRKPIDTSLLGLKQILSLFETATDEVRRYVAYECEIMFECRVCRTIFRSLANFILHKRSYCSDVYKPIDNNNRTDIENNDTEILEKDVVSSDDKSDSEVVTHRYPKRNISNVLKKLADKQECQKIAEEVMNEELTEKAYLETTELGEKVNKICLEKIEGNAEGVFQTNPSKRFSDEFMKSEVMEIHSILNTNEAILDSDGKVFNFKNIDTNVVDQKLMCTICDLKFATKKTLTHHIKYIHNNTRILYVCPECKDTFANAWGVFRHLYKIHRKTSMQVRRMRDQIHSNTIISKHNIIETKTSPTFDCLNEDENQENELQSCCGCRKRFDRKAAFHSHIQMCLKRSSLLNIKEKEKANQEKEKANQEKEKANLEKEKANQEKEKASQEKDLTKENAPILKGARKRKQEISKKIERQEEVTQENNKMEEEITNLVGKDNIENKSNIVADVKDTTDSNTTNNNTSDINITDTNTTDVNTIDANAIDANTTDTNATDANTIDVNTSDTNTTDANTIDANAIDVNTSDTNTPDTKTGNDNIEKCTELNEKDLIHEVIFGGTHQNVTEVTMNTCILKRYVSYVTEEDETLGFASEYKQINDDESSKSSDNSVLNDLNDDCNRMEVINAKINEATNNENGIDYIEETAETANDFECEENEQTIIRSEIIIDDPIQSSLENNVELLEVDNLKETENNVIIEEVEVTTIDSDCEENNAVIFSEYDYGEKDYIPIETDAVIYSTDDTRLFIDDSDKGICNNEIVTTDVIPSTVTSGDVVVESEEPIYISDSTSCSCFDEKSNDSVSTLASNKATISDDLHVEELTYEKSPIRIATYSRKRKKSEESEEFNDETELVFNQKCENYVDWNACVCKPCSTTFSTNDDLMNHMALHFNWLQYQCDKCTFMSYDRSTCLQHNCIKDVRREMIKYLIVRLPHWKTLSMATSFNLIREQNVSEDSDSSRDDYEQNKFPSLTCNKVNTQDPSIRKMIMEVIFGTQETVANEPIVPNLNSRPVRNRTSIKNVQKDFEYDMKQIDSKRRKKVNESKVKPIKIIKNTETNVHVVNLDAVDSRKKKRTN